MSLPILQANDQNILTGAVISSTVTPATGYDLPTLSYNRPDFRVNFGNTSVTLTWTLAAPALGDVLVIPMSNLRNGSVTLTNGSGFSQNIPVPTGLRNGIAKTIVVDLKALVPLAATRTSNVWHLVVAANVVNVVMGGAIAIYSPLTALLTRNFQWGYTTSKQGMVVEVMNEYGTRFIQDTTAMQRSITLQTVATTADADILEAWFDGNNGRGRPGLLWLDRAVEDAHFGIWQPKFEREVGAGKVLNTDVVKMTFEELAKGIPL